MSAAPLRVVAADDSSLNLEVIRLTLDLIDAQASAFESGQQAVRHLMALETPPDLFIVDRMLADIDGIEIIRRLRADRRFDRMPILIASAATDPDDIREGLAAGADRYLAKPFAPQELLDAVAQLTARGA